MHNSIVCIVWPQLLDKSQQDRVFQLLSEAESSAESSVSSTRANKSQQVYIHTVYTMCL